jgi:hypothetical protein
MTDFLSYIKTDYTQICNNVYLFNTIGKEDFHNIYEIYYNAIQLKNSNIDKSIIMFNDCINLIESKIGNELQQNNDYIVSLYKDILYESYINLSLIYTNINTDNINNIFTNNYFELIKKYYEKASKIYYDRAEPYFYFGIYCNKINKLEDAFLSLINAKNRDFTKISHIYPTAQKSAYGLYVNEELIYTCFHLKKYEDCIKYIYEIIYNSDFNNINSKLNNYLLVIQDIKDNQ